VTRWPGRGRLLPGGMLPCTVVPVFDRPVPTELARVAAEQEHPRLRVWAIDAGTRWWCWHIYGPRGEYIDSGTRRSWPEALAVGLAALEQASAFTSER